MPMARAWAFMRRANAASPPAIPSASVMAASLPEAMMSPRKRSSIRGWLPAAANMLEPPDSASPSVAAWAETGNVSSSFKRPEASSLKTTSAVRILVVEAGDIGASAFFCNRTLPELSSISRA